MRCNFVLFITTEKIGGRTAFVSSFTVKMIKLKNFQAVRTVFTVQKNKKTSKP